MITKFRAIMAGSALALVTIATATLAVPGEFATSEASAPYERFLEASNDNELVSRGLFKKKWKAEESVHNATDGTWIAVVNDPKTGKNESVGEYGSRAEADEAAQDFADFANGKGVVDGPGCNAPGVVC